MDNNYQNSISLDLEKALADESVAPIDLRFWFLKAITQDFSADQLIDVGGFGSVYKGVLPNGIIVAVKKLHDNKLIEVQEKDFLHEVDCLIEVLESWTNTFGTSKSNPPLEEVKLCVEIGIDCMHDDPSKRPHIQDIIRRLNETDISVQQLGRFYQYYRQAKQACKPMRIIASMAPELRPCWSSESALLDVHPLELCFPFEAKKVTQCSLNLVNRTHQYFACFIRQQFQDMYAIDQRIYDLSPMSTVVLTVKMVRQETPPLDAGMFEILMISMESNKDLQNLESSIDNDSQKNDDDLLKRVEEFDGEVHAAVLKAVICPPKDPAPKAVFWDGERRTSKEEAEWQLAGWRLRHPSEKPASAGPSPTSARGQRTRAGVDRGRLFPGEAI
ncbi:unnamed protein product [Miscanthus lutarioriparius]|uniref:Uncharacterized protein n=1 Tax=Miscanthus lutarioriparius TaxID=422564 RepID=A0A811REV3_9POAL|nr:unnamed protein product [Miscanthus lutarioriparius]